MAVKTGTKYVGNWISERSFTNKKDAEKEASQLKKRYSYQTKITKQSGVYKYRLYFRRPIG